MTTRMARATAVAVLLVTAVREGMGSACKVVVAVLSVMAVLEVMDSDDIMRHRQVHLRPWLFA